jgi:linoleoyl-CoA desaturase
MEKPSYLKDSEDARLFNELRKKVNQRVEAISENRDIYIQIKAIILPLIYLGLYFCILMLRNIGFIFEFCFNGNFSGFDLSEFNS